MRYAFLFEQNLKIANYFGDMGEETERCGIGLYSPLESVKTFVGISYTDVIISKLEVQESESQN